MVLTGLRVCGDVVVAIGVEDKTCESLEGCRVSGMNAELLEGPCSLV